MSDRCKVKEAISVPNKPTKSMIPSQSTAASLPPETRQKLGIEVLAKTKPVSQLAAEHQVSRKFLYQQGEKAQIALEEIFEPKVSDKEVLFNLPSY